MIGFMEEATMRPHPERSRDETEIIVKYILSLRNK